jgi:hypothetical protein
MHLEDDVEEATKKALNLLEQSAMFAKEFIERHGPQAWDTILWVYTINGLHWLVWGGFFTLVSMIVFTYAWLCHRDYKKNPTVDVIRYKRVVKLRPDGTEYRGYDNKYEDQPDSTFKAPNVEADVKRWIALAVAIVISVPSFFIMSSPWTYVAVFKPELAVARDVFNKATK